MTYYGTVTFAGRPRCCFNCGAVNTTQRFYQDETGKLATECVACAAIKTEDVPMRYRKW